MPVTSPDNLPSPNPTDNFNLVADLATMQTANQATFIKRANLYVGTAAQRTAFTTAAAGVHWQDTDGTQLEYVRLGGNWVALGSRSYAGPAANRAGLLALVPDGSTYRDTDGQLFSWIKTGGAWAVPKGRTVSGTESGISVTVGSSNSRAVTFPSGAFTSNPTVVLQIASPASRQRYTLVNPVSVTASGFNISTYAYEGTSFTDLNVNWIATAP